MKPKKLEEFVSFDPIINPETLNTIATKLIGDKDSEHFLVIALNMKHEVIDIHVTHIRQLNSSLIHLRVFKILIMCNTVAFAIAHNYPSGKTNPSQQDVEVTVRLIDRVIMNGYRTDSLTC